MDGLLGGLMGGLASGVGKELCSVVIGALKQSTKSSISMGASSRREELERLSLIIDKIESPDQLKEQAHAIDTIIADVSAVDPIAREQFDAAKLAIQQVFHQHNQQGQNIGKNEGTINITQNFGAAGQQSDQPNAKATPRINNAPPHNLHFTGREDLLRRLQAKLNVEGKTALSALNGLGGIGKSQIAIEYCHRNRANYQVIWWMDVEKKTALSTQFSDLAVKLNLGSRHQSDENTLRELALNWLRDPIPQGTRWLLIFDNAEDETQVMSYLGIGEGHTIVTSRNPNWGSYGIEVEKMSQEDAVTFLINRTGNKDNEGAAKLAFELDYLPLALEQAAAYISQLSLSYQEYIQEYQTSGISIFEHARASVRSTDYPDSVARTWDLSIAAAAKKCEESVHLLAFCAFIAPTDIPEKELKLKEISNYKLALAALNDYSLIRRNDLGALSMHRLVQAVTRDMLSFENYQIALNRAITQVAFCFPSNSGDHDQWDTCQRLLSHALAVLEYSNVNGIDTQQKSILLNHVAMYFVALAWFDEAFVMLDEAVKLSETAWGPDHRNTATALGNFGLVLMDKGKDKKAAEYLRRALTIDLAALGGDHHNTIRERANLGYCLIGLGEFNEAEKLLKESLEALYEKKDQDIKFIATIENNLGRLYEESRDVSKAIIQYEKALELNIRATGTRISPDIAIQLNNLATAHISNKQPLKAYRYVTEAIKIDKMFYGETHPQVATDLNTLGGVLLAMRKYIFAEQVVRKAINIYNSFYKEQNASTVDPHLTLGYLHIRKFDLEGALSLITNAERVITEQLGPKHHRAIYAASLVNLVIELMNKQPSEQRSIINNMFPE